MWCVTHALLDDATIATPFLTTEGCLPNGRRPVDIHVD
jgi:hypothetical protein